jgi:hypothetical protein
MPAIYKVRKLRMQEGERERKHCENECESIDIALCDKELERSGLFG